MAVAIVSVTGFIAVSMACDGERYSKPGFPISPMLERAGQLVSLKDARAGVSYAVPELPSMALKNACGSGSPRIALLAVKKSGNRVLLSYSHGLWLESAPLTDQFRPQNAYTSAGPKRILTGEVRGHPAQITPAGSGVKFFCRRDFSCSEAMMDGASGGRYYFGGSEVRWIENNVAVALQGPYSDSALAQLAEELLFKRA